MKWTKPTLITLAAIGVVFGVALIVSEWRLSDTENRLARAEERLAAAEAQIEEFEANPENLNYDLEELRQWNCANAWGSLSEEQARAHYSALERRRERNYVIVPPAVLELIDKYCE